MMSWDDVRFIANQPRVGDPRADSLDHWLNTKPAEHISSPKQCFMQEDKIAAVWMSAWRYAAAHYGKNI